MTTNEQITTARWRCLAKGCNPVLNETSAGDHRAATGHRVARWPVRSAEGKRRARLRNRTGYYDKYNVGEKAYGARVEGGHLRDDFDPAMVGISLEEVADDAMERGEGACDV